MKSLHLRFPLSRAALFLSALAPALTIAQVPNAGQISRQLEQNKTVPDRLPPPESPFIDDLTAGETGVGVLVKSISITGAEKLESGNVLQSLVADAIGKNLGFTQLQQLAERISQHLKGKGWLLAKAYLPKQDVTEGNIQIIVTQGHLETDQEGRSIHIERDPGTRLKDSVIQDRLRYVISGDSSLDGGELERALLLLNDLPGVQAHATLEKGQASGASRLGVKVSEDARIKGNFSIDDYGNRYTGPWRGNLSGSLNDAFGIGDQLTIGGTGAEYLGQGRANYSLPIADNGLQANAHYSYLSYSIGREFTQLGDQGLAQYAGGGLSFPFIRSRAFSLWGMADYTHKILRNSSLGSTTSDKQVDNGVIGFIGQSLDSFNGGGMNQFSYNATVGNVNLADIPAELSVDKTSARTQGIYDKHVFNLARLQKLSDNFSFYAAANGQLAGKNLTSAEKFILGGPSGIRAYPVGEGNGDSGWIANFEMRYDLPYQSKIGNLQLVGFFDTGHIVLNNHGWNGAVTNATGRNQYSLSGSGIGVNFTHANLFAIRSAWAHSIGDNPGRQLSGNISDGQHETNQFWLQTMLAF